MRGSSRMGLGEVGGRLGEIAAFLIVCDKVRV